MRDLDGARKAYLKIRGGVFRMHGNSMLPLLKEGDSINVVPAQVEDLKAGDIAVFSKKGTPALTCHRIIGKLKSGNTLYFLENGDNSPRVDMVSSEDIIGKAVSLKTEEGARSLQDCRVLMPLLLQILTRIIFFHNRLAMVFKGRKRLPGSLSKAINRCYVALLKRLLRT